MKCWYTNCPVSGFYINYNCFHKYITSFHLNFKILWWYHHQAIQPISKVLDLHPIGQPMFLRPVPQHSLCLLKELLSIRCWHLIQNPGPSARILCWTLTAFHPFKSGLVDLENDRSWCKRGEKRGEIGGAFLFHWQLHRLFSVLWFLPAPPLLYLRWKESYLVLNRKKVILGEKLIFNIKNSINKWKTTFFKYLLKKLLIFIKK